MTNRPIFVLVAAMGTGFIGMGARADAVADRLEKLRPALTQLCSVPVAQWRYHQPDVPDGEQPNFDDSTWSSVAPGFSWSGENTKVWFRSTVAIPGKVAGHSVDGVPVRLDVGVDDDGELYVNGQLKEAFHWDEGQYTLVQRARLGQKFQVAVRGINGPGQGQLHFATLYFDLLPEFEQYLNEIKLLEMLVGRVPKDDADILNDALKASEEEISFTEITPQNLATVRAQLIKARVDLAPVASITRRFDVYYVGHAHIDMNWEWPWSETLDVCHRTWNSAMNLMDEFPDFRFVQSQAAAYAGIQTNQPEEFSRMQEMVRAGRWDPVGGFWDESDTDIPSGEGLARSFFLGQRFFQASFGRIATTGWLPDSFGHSWQMPQIMRLVGISNYYHVRCGTEMELSWWESPDGSRVLKANTANYGEGVALDQLAVPAEIEQQLGLPQSITVYGVSDHGGGPTREYLLRIKSYQDDPLLPRVHFSSADKFFEQLTQRARTQSLPVVATDLQYTFVGCYTTHADSKKAIRSSENELYSAEVLSSLASMTGQSYPVAEFKNAWKPAAFSQFHDIACGSAYHPTYDWMHEQYAPAMRFVRQQTEKCLDNLSAQVDTRGPSPVAIVVWNTLSIERTDVVKVSLPEAQKYRAVTDRQGRRFPAQVMDVTNLVFVARDVPAFGSEVYFPSTDAGGSDQADFKDAGGAYDMQTPAYELQIDKATGAMRRLYSKSALWNVFPEAADNANSFQLLGDAANAWDIQYTGSNKILLTEGADVAVLDQGPVFARVRVRHFLGKSAYTQDVIAYGALPRIDVAATVVWQEEHQLLKILLPLNTEHSEVQAQIPFGSIWRPGNGQECPGQKWMDVTEYSPIPVTAAVPLNLASTFNADCTENFDGGGNAYAPETLPAAGLQKLGGDQVPFTLYSPSQDNETVAGGQEIPLPANTGQDTLYLLTARANGNKWTSLGFRMANGNIQRRAFALNDWVVNTYGDNEAGVTMQGRKTGAGRDIYPTHFWIVRLPLPDGARGLILPRDANVHFFAATSAKKPEPAPRYGLSILNDCKYGFDLTSNVFRLTALRSSTDPDPHPDQGMQTFTYSLYPHAGDWRKADTENQALALNVPLLARVAAPHEPRGTLPSLSITNMTGAGQLVVTALKHSEDGKGYVLRFYEAAGQDTVAGVDFGRKVEVEATDILERPLPGHPIEYRGNLATLPVGHNQIVTLRIDAEND